MKRLLPHIGCVAILLLFAAIYYADIIQRLPFGIHEWAQADRLSLAINFYDNGLNFFKPATYAQISANGIVGVEFPIQSYIAALLGCVFGRGAINACFRIEGILLACTGLYFLFRIAHDRSKDFLLSMLPPVLIFCSPVFVFYSAAYLPDPAAVSIDFIALFCFLRYADSVSLRAIIVSILLATVGVLMKASTVGCWAGIVFYALYNELFRRKAIRQAVIISGVALACALLVVAQVWYIDYLNKTYNAYLFLARTMPFADWDAFNSFAENNFKDHWMGDYFLLVEYPIIILLVAIGLRLLSQDKMRRHYRLPLFVFVPACLFLFYLFGAQFPVHDYYIIAIFFPLIAYLLVLAVIGIAQQFSTADKRHLRMGLGVTALFLFFMADHQNYQRFHLERHYDEPYSFPDWIGGAALLDSLHIPKKEFLLVGGDNPPNLALAYFDRRGHAVPKDDFKDNIQEAERILKERGWKYLAIRQGAYNHIRDTDSAGLQHFKLLALSHDKAILMLRNTP